jgi:asparagine synthase (glutamine-hydrolysing)
MFAFAYHDMRSNKVLLARDRYGIKPLYYSVTPELVVFASELRAMSIFCAPRISQSAITDYLRQGSIAGPQTIYENVFALSPGHFLEFNLGTQGERASAIASEAQPIARAGQQWWSLSSIYASAAQNPTTLADSTVINNLKESFEQSIDAHLVSDVPVGIFLSAGLDSSTIAAVAAKQSKAQLRAFTLSFPELSADEAPFASQIARSIGVDHSCVEFNTSAVTGLLPDFFDAMDSPTVDGLNSYLIAKAASASGLKVALSGLGADELLGSYPSFQDIPRLHRLRSFVPESSLIEKATAATVQMYGVPTTKVLWLLRAAPSIPAVYSVYRGLFFGREFDTSIQRACAAADRIQPATPDLPSALLISYLETTRYMANQLLRDIDAFSMHSSLEVRVPFVDEVFAEAALPLLAGNDVSTLKSKLFRAIAPNLPDFVFARPKTGFSIPMDNWLRAPHLRRQLEKGESYETISSIISLKNFQSIVQRYYSGRVHWSRPWALYVLAEWIRERGLTLGSGSK